MSTSFGRRVIDNLTPGRIAQEAKVGRTSLTRRIRNQIAKDVDLLSTGAVEGVEWHFFGSSTGVGPTGPLREALVEAGIDIILH